LKGLAKRIVRQRQRQGRGQTGGDIDGKAGAGQHARIHTGQIARDQLARRQASRQMNALGTGDHRVGMTGQDRQNFTQFLRRHRQEQNIRPQVREFSRHTKAIGKAVARQTAGVFARGLHVLGPGTRPQRYLGPGAGQRDGKRRAKRPGTGDIDPVHALAPFLPDPISAGLVRSSGQRGRADRSIPSR
jgi:hypothetical protein